MKLAEYRKELEYIKKKLEDIKYELNKKKQRKK